MASKTSIKKCSTTIKADKIEENNLSKKLQFALERDLLRLFQSSLYCDIKLTVNTSHLLTHSCLLQTRAFKFYKFIYKEFEVFNQDGISVFNFYNASFPYLQTFIQNVYTDIHTANAEDSIIKHLQDCKTRLTVRTIEENINTLPESNPVSSEIDLFFTPKCSPSELQKSFAPSGLKLKDSNVVSYYKIVSVDDIPADDKFEGDKVKQNHKLIEEEELELELAEQDELLLSFKTIFTKKAKNKPNLHSHSNSSQTTKKVKPKVYKKLDSKSDNQCIPDHTKNKFAFRQSNVGNKIESNSLNDKHSKLINSKRKNSNFCNSLIKPHSRDCHSGENLERASSLCSSEMDVSTTGFDSGLDNSSLCQVETSPRETTTSETSGVVLTEMTINDDIPNDEILSKNRSGSTETSLSSEVETWDGNEDVKTKIQSGVKVVENQNEINETTDRLNGNDDGSDENNDKNGLNEDELIRLDKMEKNIRDCEIFLCMERRQSDVVFNDLHCKTYDKINEDSIENEKIDNDDIVCKPKFVLNAKMGSNLTECEGDTKILTNQDSLYAYNDFNNKQTKSPMQDSHFTSLASSNNDSGESYNHNSIQETKTPPCTPKKLKLEIDEKINFPEGKSDKMDKNHCTGTGISNYFIDASSLLDEDELKSPPSISLVNVKKFSDYQENESNDENIEQMTSKAVVSNFFYPRLNDDDDDEGEGKKMIIQLQEKEKQQGDTLFRNSILHFSKHDIDNNQMENPEKISNDFSDRYCYNCDEKRPADSSVDPPNSLNLPTEIFKCRQPSSGPNSLVETHFFESTLLPRKSESSLDNDYVDENENDECDVSLNNVPEPSYESDSSSQIINKNASLLSEGINLNEAVEQNIQRKPNRNQGEAWVVTFDNDSKTKSKSMSNGQPVAEPYDANRERSKSKPSSSNIEGSEVTKLCVSDEEEVNSSSQSSFPVEKSSSLGYFLDFGKASDQKSLRSKRDKVENSAEKKNMFSMFIEIDDNPKSVVSRKPKKTLEEIHDKSCDEESNGDTPSMTSDVAESQDEMKRPFYMFIESDSPHVKRKQMPRHFGKSPAESSNKKTYLRTESYTIESHPEENEKLKSEDCLSSDNSLLHIENEAKPKRSSRSKHPVHNTKLEESKSRNIKPKITAWSEAKPPKDGSVSGESWLNTKDIFINYTGKSSEQINELCLKKDSTFIMGESKNKNSDRFSTNENFSDGRVYSKLADRDSGVGLNHEDNEVSFVKLSDMDKLNTENHRKNRSGDKMSQSISDTGGGRREIENGVSSLSKSIENDVERTGTSSLRINRSLSRLFPNLSTQSLASLSRRDVNKGDKEVQGSAYSETNTSLQSSAEPSGLDISTSETDISSHVGNSSRLGEDLLRMFLEEIGPDVTVEVAGRRIKAHKCILSSRCQYFAATLSGGWVESAGNVISLQGFTYNAVHFALRYIYSGESRIPESLNIVELATLADMLCLDGLQEIISYNLKVKYCHSFHVPCSICSVGVLDCLPIAATYGLDELYRKCLRWITKYFVKLWPTKSFGSLPKELLEKCYQHYVVHMSVDNVLDTVVNIDKVRGSLTNVRWAETVSRLVKKLNDSTVRFIAEHFSSVLISDNFLALGKEDGWNLGRIEDSLIEAIRYLPPEQACWSHAQLHRILSVANGPDPPPEMDWNENFIKLLHIIAGLVESSLIKQAPRAAKSKAWRQLEPELRNRIQEAACLVLPDDEPSPTLRKPHQVRKSFSQPSVPQTAKSRILELKQIKLAMTQKANRDQNNISSRPLSLQIDQRPKNTARFAPLRTSASTSSVRRSEPVEYIRKAQSKTHVPANVSSEPKKSLNPRYSEIKSRYLEPKSPQKSLPEKSSSAIPTSTTNQVQRRNLKYISSSDSSRNYSPALRPSNSKTSVPQVKKPTGGNRQSRDQIADSRRSRNLSTTRTEATPGKLSGRLVAEDYMSTDSLCTDSLQSEKDATFRRKSQDSDYGTNGKENVKKVYGKGNSLPVRSKVKSLNTENRSSSTSKPIDKFIMPSQKAAVNDTWKASPGKRMTSGKSQSAGGNQVKRPITQKGAGAASSPRTYSNRNSGKADSNSVNGNAASRRKSEVDSENNRKSTKEESQTPCGLSRSGTFLKEEPTILKKPQMIDGINGRL